MPSVSPFDPDNYLAEYLDLSRAVGALVGMAFLLVPVMNIDI